ncbi:MAG: hypothetical protein HY276_04560 [Ignavibacteriales bacterium]|nr:hypothetical protein [Ignavibacteriales bacterium]
METILAFAQLLALLCVSALCIYLIVVLSQFKKDFTEFNQRSKPVLENLSFITEKLKSAATKIDEQVDIVKTSLESVKTVADSVVMLERRIQEQLEGPIMQVASVIGSTISGITAFFNRYRNL